MARAANGANPNGTVETQIPARLDRLPWASWHWLVARLEGYRSRAESSTA